MVRPQKIHKRIESDFNTVLVAIANGQRPQEQTIEAKPFVKWVGGKRSILDELIKRLPEKYDVYCEPFIGGGALYFAIQPKKAYLADINFPLVITYRVIRDQVEELIEKLETHNKKHNKEYYLKQRERMSEASDPVEIASIFIYLNKTCFNGLYRVNKSGKFNVPMGKYKNPPILDPDNLRNTSKVLQGAVINQHGFEHQPITKGAFYYLDPPYHQTYDGYNDDGFGDEAHERLAEFCRQINLKGGYFMLSNSDTPLVRKLYKGYNIEVVSAARSVSCKAHQRKRENELIIRNYN